MGESVTRSMSEPVVSRTAADAGSAIRPRGRLLWWVLLLAAGGAAYAGMVIWQRDTVRRQQAMGTLGVYHSALRASLEASAGRIPLALPATTPDGKALPAKGFTYLTAEAAQMLRDYSGPVLLGYGPRVPQGLRSGGHAILVCERGQCSARWLTDSEFNTWLAEQNGWVKQHRQELLERKPIVP
jgi:hypothetical protein